MDPVEQIFAQARAPTGSWEGPIQSFWKARQAQQEDIQLGQQQQKIDLEKQILPLKMEAERLSQLETGLDIKNKLAAQQRSVDVKNGEGEALDIMLTADKTPNGYLSEDIFNRIHDLSKRNPAVFAAPIGISLLHNFKGARMADESMRRAQGANLPVRRITVDPETGKETITYEAPDETLQELRRANALRATAQAEGRIGGAGGLTAIARNSKLLEDAQAAYDTTLAAQADASTEEEKSAADVIVQSAKTHLEAIKAFVPHTNEAVKMQHQELMAAYGAQKQALLADLRAVEADFELMGKPKEKASKIKALHDKLNELEKKYFPGLSVGTPATPTIDQDKATVLEDARTAIARVNGMNLPPGKKAEAVAKIKDRLKNLGITEEP
jgi:hypothetical protein